MYPNSLMIILVSGRRASAVTFDDSGVDPDVAQLQDDLNTKSRGSSTERLFNDFYSE